MGSISLKLLNNLRKGLTQKIINLREFSDNQKKVNDLMQDVINVEESIKDGMDPQHTLYAYGQNLISVFLDIIAGSPIFRPFCKKYFAAEDEYMPKGPPLSPITLSYFTSWGFFDLTFGKDKETITTCLIDVSDYLKLSPDVIFVLKNMQASRMGIYKHLGTDKGKVIFRELYTHKEIYCHSTSGYLGKKNQLWYVRIMPPIDDMFNYSIIFTTPYILLNSNENDWIDYFTRTLPKIKLTDKKSAFIFLMKYGLNDTYWNEYVFQGYHHYQYDAIFLEGIPDIKDSLPHPY